MANETEGNQNNMQDPQTPIRIALWHYVIRELIHSATTPSDLDSEHFDL